MGGGGGGERVRKLNELSGTIYTHRFVYLIV